MLYFSHLILQMLHEVEGSKTERLGDSSVLTWIISGGVSIGTQLLLTRGLCCVHCSITVSLSTKIAAPKYCCKVCQVDVFWR